MAPRLLSFLALIESALGTLESPAVLSRPSRIVNFPKNVARMAFADGSGWIMLQTFTLADGEVCLRSDFGWANTEATGTCSIFPKGDNFDWFGAAAKVAEAWMNGPPAQPAARPLETLPAAS